MSKKEKLTPIGFRISIEDRLKINELAMWHLKNGNKSDYRAVLLEAVEFRLKKIKK